MWIESDNIHGIVVRVESNDIYMKAGLLTAGNLANVSEKSLLNKDQTQEQEWKGLVCQILQGLEKCLEGFFTLLWKAVSMLVSLKLKSHVKVKIITKVKIKLYKYLWLGCNVHKGSKATKRKILANFNLSTNSKSSLPLSLTHKFPW